MEQTNMQIPADCDSSGPIAWMARNTVAANLLMILFLVGGLIIATRVKQEVFPEFATDIISIDVAYPGASPAEVEQGIILSIEDGVRGVDGVKEVNGRAFEGAASVLVELFTSVDTGKALQDIKNEVDRISSFPEDAESPIVSLIETRRQVVSIVVYGDKEETELREIGEVIRDELLQSKGITQVELGAVRPLEIAIEVSQENLRAFNLTLEQIANQIRQTAIEIPAGTVRTRGGQILLRTKERRDYGIEYQDIPVVTNADGTFVTIKDIAVIRDDFAEIDAEAQFDGKRAIRINVFRVGEETPQSVAAEVSRFIAEFQTRLPDTVQLVMWDDMSILYKDRMGLLLKNAALGLFLVLLLLGLFLDLRLAFWVTLGIPISIMGAFLFIPVTGASINMISLFAFIVTLGIVVDDAVIMGENIFDYREKGLSPLKAAIKGSQGMAKPVVFAVLTNIVAFLPLFFAPGIAGKFFRQIPLITVSVFIVSLIEALFILPAHLSHKPKPGTLWRIMDIPRSKAATILNSIIHNKYLPAITLLTNYRYATFCSGIALLVLAAGTVAGGHIDFTFMPKIDSDVVTVQATLPVGTPMPESRRIRDLLVTAAQRSLERTGGSQMAKGVYGSIGIQLVRHGPAPSISSGGGSHIIAAQVYLISSDKRDFSGAQFKNIWRSEIGDIVGIESLVFRSETGAREGAALDIELSHRSKDILEKAAVELGEIFKGYPGVTDVDDGVTAGKPQLSFTVTPEAQAVGITASDLARQVRSAFYGAEALRQQRGRNEVKVMVRLPEQERQTMYTVEQLVIKTPSGGELPLAQAANIEYGRSYTTISRREGRRVISVNGDVDNTKANAGKVLARIVKEDIPALQDKYPGLKYGFEGEQQARIETMDALKVGFSIALILIYILLAVPFKSYIQPAIVMLSIPFGIIGAVGGHFLLGYDLSIISMFGIVALSGVVVNDALVLVVTANEMRDQQGLSPSQAIKLAGARRFRPILLTSLTTFLGLAPMIFESSLQARFLIPMAISLGFGILFSTVIVLGIVPAAYLIVEDVKRLWR